MQLIIALAFGLLQSGVTTGQPQHLLSANAGSPVIRIGDYIGRVKVKTIPKKVEIHWTFSPPSFDFTSGSRPPEGTQLIALSYYPTAATLLHDGSMCVAGKRGRGATVVEIIRFNPDISPSLGVNIQTGLATVNPPPVIHIDDVLDESLVGRDGIVGLVKNRVNTNAVFVHYFDSRDVYALDLTTGALELIASPNSQAGILHAPELTRNFANYRNRRHITVGDMYTFSSPSVPDTGVLCLVDGDKDGEVDSVLSLLDEEWAQLGYGDPANYE